MKLSPLSSIAIKSLVSCALLTSACATSGIKPGPRVSKVPNGLAAYKTTSIESQAMLSRLKDGDDVPKKIFDFFCGPGGQPRRAVTSELIFPVPSLRGIPIDRANAIQSQVLSEVRRFVSGAYDIATRGDSSHSDCTIPTNRRADLTRSLQGDSLRYIAFAGDNPKQPVQLMSHFFLVNTEGTTLIASDSIVACYKEESGSWESIDRHPPSSQEPGYLGDPDGPKYFTAADPITFEAGGFESDRKWMVKDHTESPLAPVALGDLATLRYQFALLLPDDLYDKVQVLRGFPKGSAGHLSIMKAVEDRDLIWQGFFRLATKIREAPAKEPGLEAFEVNLDLGLMCRYARPVRDLISK